MMNYQHVLFLLSIALQLSGALILILFYWSNTEQLILNTVFPANAIIHRENDNHVIISKEKLVKAHKNVLLNRTAFILIGMGCLLNIFGVNSGLCIWVGMVAVITVSILIMAIGVYACHVIAKKCNKNDRSYSYESLCSKLESDIVTNVIDPEIDKISKDLGII